MLRLAVYDENIPISSHGLIPMLLVYRMLPKIPSVSGTGAIPRDERAEFACVAGGVCEERPTDSVALGLKKNIPSAKVEISEKGDKS